MTSYSVPWQVSYDGMTEQLGLEHEVKAVDGAFGMEGGSHASVEGVARACGLDSDIVQVGHADFPS